MASADYNLQLKITADNQATWELDKVSKSAQNLQKQSFQWSKSTEATLKKVWATATIVAWSMVALWKSFVDASIENEPLQRSFESLSKSAGIASDEMLKAMRKASRWTVADTQLMASANKAYSLWIVKNAEDMATMMEIARVKWQAMWRTMEEALDDITTWLWRGSAQILDNLWIVVKASEANEEYAKSIGKSVKELTEEEKKQALVNAVVSQWKKELEEMWEVQETMQEKIARVNAQWENTKNKIWDALIPVIEKLLTAITPIIEKVANWIDKNPELTAWIFTAITAIAWLTAVVSWLALALPAIWTAITVLSWPIWWIIGAIALVATAWAKNWWWIREKTAETVEKIKEIVKPRLDKISEWWENHKEMIMAIVRLLRDRTEKVFSAWVDIIWWLIQWLFQSIDFWIKIFSWDWEWAWESLKDMAITIVETMDNVMTDLFWQTWQSIKDWVQWVYDWIVDKLTSIVSAVKDIVWQIKDAWNSTKNAVSNFWTNAINKVKWWFGWWKAVGWPVTAWTTYLVWEKWPELFVPSTSWKIVPNNQITNNDNGITINMWNVTIRRDSDIQELAQAIVRMTKLEKNYWII